MCQQYNCCLSPMVIFFHNDVMSIRTLHKSTPSSLWFDVGTQGFPEGSAAKNPLAMQETQETWV